MELVFKDGVAYDPERLVAAVAGTLGEFPLERLFTWPVLMMLALLAILAAAHLIPIRRVRQPLAE